MEHLKQLTLDTRPGRYRVETASGTNYEITVTAGKPALLRRTHTAHQDLLYQQRSLWHDEVEIALSDYTLTVGAPGRLMFWDEGARNSPAYGRGPGLCAGTVRETTPVQRIIKVCGPPNQLVNTPVPTGANGPVC